MEQAPILIIIIPLFFALFTPLVGWLKRNLCYHWVVSALVLSSICSVSVFIRVLDTGTIHYYLGKWEPPWGIEYVIDHLNALMLVIVSLVSLSAAVYSRKSVEQEIPGKAVNFYTVFLLQVVGFLGIVITGDMFNLYVFLEIASISGYALIAIGEDDAPLAAFRYIILGTIGACFYLIGVGYLYIVTGSLNMADLARILPDPGNSRVVLIAFAFFITGIALKMALFPLHTWLPDAYTKAPSASSALIAPLMTKISVYIMIRLIYTVFGPSLPLGALSASTIMTWLGIAAIFAGAVMALAQTDFKRMLCYIIIAEAGYMIGGIGLSNATATNGVVLHVLNDSVMTAGLFAVAGIIAYRMKSHEIDGFRLLYREMPFTMAGFTVIALSIIGVPPTCGFFSKWYLILGGIIAGNWIYVAALLFSSLVNAVLFFRIFEKGYGFTIAEDPEHGHNTATLNEAPATMLVPVMSIAALIIAIGIFNQAIINNVIQYTIQRL